MGKPSKAALAAVESGKVRLREWLRRAEEHGTIYYVVERVARSGMSRDVKLATIVMIGGKPTLCNLFPSITFDAERDLGVTAHSAALDAVAKAWGFSFTKRAFVVHGCGMNMVFHLVYTLAQHAGLGGEALKFANSVRLESF